MADQEGADPLPDPTSMSKKKLIAEVIANRAQIEADKEHYRKARDLIGEKLNRYYSVNRQQEETIYYLEAQLREANRIIGRELDHGLDFRNADGQKNEAPVPVMSASKLEPPTFNPGRFGLK